MQAGADDVCMREGIEKRLRGHLRLEYCTVPGGHHCIAPKFVVSLFNSSVEGFKAGSPE